MPAIVAIDTDRLLAWSDAFVTFDLGHNRGLEPPLHHYRMIVSGTDCAR